MIPYFGAWYIGEKIDSNPAAHLTQPDSTTPYTYIAVPSHPHTSISDTPPHLLVPFSLVESSGKKKRKEGVGRFTGAARLLLIPLLSRWIQYRSTYLDKADISGLLAEALTADVEAVLADQTSLVGADAARENPVSF